MSHEEFKFLIYFWIHYNWFGKTDLMRIELLFFVWIIVINYRYFSSIYHDIYTCSLVSHWHDCWKYNIHMQYKSISLLSIILSIVPPIHTRQDHTKVQSISLKYQQQTSTLRNISSRRINYANQEPWSEYTYTHETFKICEES